MNIKLFIGTRGGMFGGAENTIVTLTQALCAKHTVEIITHSPDMTLEKFCRNVDLKNVTLRHVPEPQALPQTIRPGRRRLVRDWNAEVSRGADVFLNFANRPPPFSHARCGLMRVFFPFDTPPHQKPANGRYGRLRAWLLKREWEAKWRTYDALVANSAYTARWIKRRWGLTASVVHPPVDTDFEPAEKELLIASVGRFALFGNAKKQMELMKVFSAANDLRAAGWRYESIGGAGRGDGDAEYIEAVRGAAPPEGSVLLDLPRLQMKAALSRSRIFWHAAGWGEDPDKNPQSFEHFGQATVEAMAAGAVPVVIDGGGQREIVEHGVSGFLWKNEGELLEFTRLLVKDADLCKAMSQAAVKRAAAFGKSVFAERFVALIEKHALRNGVPL